MRSWVPRAERFSLRHQAALDSALPQHADRFGDASLPGLGRPGHLARLGVELDVDIHSRAAIVETHAQPNTPDGSRPPLAAVVTRLAR